MNDDSMNTGEREEELRMEVDQTRNSGGKNVICSKEQSPSKRFKLSPERPKAGGGEESTDDAAMNNGENNGVGGGGDAGGLQKKQSLMPSPTRTTTSMATSSSTNNHHTPAGGAGGGRRPILGESMLPFSMRIMMPFASLSRGCCTNCGENPGESFPSRGGLFLPPDYDDGDESGYSIGTRGGGMSTPGTAPTATPASVRSGRGGGNATRSENDGTPLLPEETHASSMTTPRGGETNGYHDHEDDEVESPGSKHVVATGTPKSPSVALVRSSSPPRPPISVGIGGSTVANVETLFRHYLSSCNMFNCNPNPGVLTTFRFGLPSLRVSGNFHDADMLSLCEVLLHHCNTTLSFVTRLDFARATREGKLHGHFGFKSHGAMALSKVLVKSRHVSEVYVQRNKIGPYGGSALFRAVSMNPTVKTLAMRRCLLGERGAYAFVKYVIQPPTKNGKPPRGSGGHMDDLEDDTPMIRGQCGLTEVDLSINRFGFWGTKAICDALEERKAAEVERGLALTPHEGVWRDQLVSIPTMEVDLQGNLVFQEIMNCVTHGLGVLLSLVAASFLTSRVEHQPLFARVSCGVYSTSLVVLYASSTLFHSFFALRKTKYVFKILDQTAIYFLIASTYTPYLQMSCQHKPQWSVYLLGFIWMCSISGVMVEFLCPKWKHKGRFSLSMYLIIGWACVVCLPDMLEVLPQGAINLLVLGGVGYTSGVPFFVRDNNLDHSIWHLFVLLASAFHWAGVYFYVAVLGDEYAARAAESIATCSD